MNKHYLSKQPAHPAPAAVLLLRRSSRTVSISNTCSRVSSPSSHSLFPHGLSFVSPRQPPCLYRLCTLPLIHLSDIELKLRVRHCARDAIKKEAQFRSELIFHGGCSSSGPVTAGPCWDHSCVFRLLSPPPPKPIRVRPTCLIGFYLAAPLTLVVFTPVPCDVQGPLWTIQRIP